MRSKRGPLGLFVLAAAFLVFAFGASSAQAEFGIAKWEALTCNTDESAAGLGNWEANGTLCEETSEPKDFFNQAAGHPNFGITAFNMNQVAPGNFPDGFVKELRFELPEGLGVNPRATEQCTVDELAEIKEELPPEPGELAPIIVPNCPAGSRVGTNYFSVYNPKIPAELTAKVFVYNVETPADPESEFYGASSLAGFNATGEPTYLVGDLDPVDQHISFTIHDIKSPLAGGTPIVGSRLVFEREGEASAGTYVTLPTVCGGPQETILKALSHPEPPPAGPELEREATSVSPFVGEGCDKVPFDPGLDVTVDSQTGSPDPATVNVTIPFNPDPEGLINSHLKVAKVVLPEGAGINPSAVNGLETCTDAQFKQGTDDPIGCPTASQIGSVEVETPSLPGIFGGEVYAAQPLSNNPSSGEQFRIFLHVVEPRFDVNVRLEGKVFPNLQTGQVTAVVADNPQAPFESFRVKIDGGPGGVLTTPGSCGPHTTTATYTPFSGTADQTRTSDFTLDEAGYGGPCPGTLAERRFAPGYFAAPEGTKAGAYSPFRLNFNLADGEQEVKRFDVDLPPGMIGKLRGLEYCPQANIDAAGAASGTATTAVPPCPNSSWVGSVLVAAGSGPAPYKAPGNVYLAGPYKGAPISLVFVTPALAGPWDLGTVVVRAALYVDPETTEVSAVSDPIPDVFGGVKLSIQGISVALTRQKFTLNPTTCREQFQIASQIWGGGGNPANAAQWQAVNRQNGFRGSNCKALQFKPKFYARIFGGKNQTRRAQNPKFRAIYDPRNGDANLRRAAFILPRATILDQSHIRTICTRVQLAANNCPKASIYGNAKATSPLLDEPLKGPVYLTSSNNELPDLLADLRGQVNVQLRGVISGKNARLKTVFRKTPDVPVDKFILTMKGGNRGLLINSRNLCTSQTSGFLNLLAQNSRRERNKNLRLNIPACRK